MTAFTVGFLWLIACWLEPLIYPGVVLRGGIGEVNQNSSFFLTPVLKIETWVQNEVMEP